jgi:hypothetical protein
LLVEAIESALANPVQIAGGMETIKIAVGSAED